MNAFLQHRIGGRGCGATAESDDHHGAAGAAALNSAARLRDDLATRLCDVGKELDMIVSRFVLRHYAPRDFSVRLYTDGRTSHRSRSHLLWCVGVCAVRVWRVKGVN